MAESLEELIEKLRLWKGKLEAKGLRVNMGKTKIMLSGNDLNSLVDSGKCPCSVCRKGVGCNSILCEGCGLWVHKKCSGVRGKIRSDPDFRCKRCLGLARPIDGRPVKHVMLDDHKLDVVDTFCYLGDTICPEGSCEASTIARVRSAWGKFRELLPLLTSKAITLARRGMVYNSCVRSAMLHASECWAPRSEDKQRLLRNERAMLRWICGVRLKDRVSGSSLLERLKIDSLETVLRVNRLRWFGHVQRSDGWIKRCTELHIDGQRGRGRPKKTWRQAIDDDMKTWRIPPNTTDDRMAWRQALRTTTKSPTRGRRGQVAIN